MRLYATLYLSLYFFGHFSMGLPHPTGGRLFLFFVSTPKKIERKKKAGHLSFFPFFLSGSRCTAVESLGQTCC